MGVRFTVISGLVCVIRAYTHQACSSRISSKFETLAHRQSVKTRDALLGMIWTNCTSSSTTSGTGDEGEVQRDLLFSSAQQATCIDWHNKTNFFTMLAGRTLSNTDGRNCIRNCWSLWVPRKTCTAPCTDPLNNPYFSAM